MAVEGNNQKVRARIDAIVGAQENAEMQQAAPKRQRKVTKKTLTVILASLCVVIVGLVVAIVVVAKPWDQPVEVEPNIADTTENKVLIKCDDLLYRMNTDENYSTEEAIENLETEIDYSDGVSKIYATLCYANIATTLENNAETAIEKMLDVEALVKKEDVSTRLDYYSTLRILYQKNCDSEKYEYYSRLLNELSEDTSDDYIIGNQMEFEVEGEQ